MSAFSKIFAKQFHFSLTLTVFVNFLDFSIKFFPLTLPGFPGERPPCIG